MIPRLLSFGPLPINSFGLMVALGILSGVFVLESSFSRQGINPKLAERYALGAGFSGIVGARLWYILENWALLQHDLWGALTAGAGFTFYGGFILATIVLYFMTLWDGIKLHKLVDSVGPALALSYAIGRVGCQLAGDGDYGIATTTVFGMSYGTGVVPTPPGILVFPTPFFESLMSLLVFVILIKLEESGRCSRPFKRFGIYLALMSVERFLIEFIRVNPKLVGVLSEAQVLAIGLFLVGLSCIMFLGHSKASNAT